MLKRLMILFFAAAALMFCVGLYAQAKSGKPASVKCAHCGEMKIPAVKVENGAGQKVDLCKDCADLPRCAYCQMPFVVVSPGEDRLCRDCAKDMIKDEAEAEKVMNDVRQVLSTKFKMTTKHKIICEIRPRPEIYLEADGEHLELGWFDSNPINGKPRYRIRILTGLPRDVFRAVAAHELAHDWMEENLPHLMDKDIIREGFAEFVAWSFSQAEGLKRMMKYTENRTDDVYGGGFRKVREMMGKTKTAPEWKKVLDREFPLKQKKKSDR